MVEMSMRQQQTVEPPEPGAASQQLPLGALSAIDQYPVAARFNKESGMISFG